MDYKKDFFQLIKKISIGFPEGLFVDIKFMLKA